MINSLIIITKNKIKNKNKNKIKIINMNSFFQNKETVISLYYIKTDFLFLLGFIYSYIII